MINESFGTHEGDRTLHYCMQILRKNVKEGEIAGQGKCGRFFLCLKEGNRNIGGGKASGNRQGD